jgi:hypothetical protein
MFRFAQHDRAIYATCPKQRIAFNCPGLEDAVRKEYKGPFVIARDLMVINVGKTVTWNGKSSADTTPDGDKSGR